MINREELSRIDSETTFHITDLACIELSSRIIDFVIGLGRKIESVSPDDMGGISIRLMVSGGLCSIDVESGGDVWICRNEGNTESIVNVTDDYWAEIAHLLV